MIATTIFVAPVACAICHGPLTVIRVGAPIYRTAICKNPKCKAYVRPKEVSLYTVVPSKQMTAPSTAPQAAATEFSGGTHTFTGAPIASTRTTAAADANAGREGIWSRILNEFRRWLSR